MSFARPERTERRNSMPMTPVIDVLFILLIFFAVTSTFRAQERQQDVELPKTETGNTVEHTPMEIVINVLKDGTVMLAERKLALPELRKLLVDLHVSTPNERVIIRGDKEALHGDVQAVLDAARSAGFKHAGIAVDRRDLSSE